MKPAPQSRILAIGVDTALAHLRGRYVEQSGCGIAMMQNIPPTTEVCSLQPPASLFLSYKNLGAAQLLLADLGDCDIPIWVCSSVADKARARELGADHCLLHPRTYDSILAALAATRAP